MLTDGILVALPTMMFSTLGHSSIARLHPHSIASQPTLSQGLVSCARANRVIALCPIGILATLAACYSAYTTCSVSASRIGATDLARTRHAGTEDVLMCAQCRREHALAYPL